MEIRWKKNFASERTQQFYKAQCMVDSECLRTIEPFMPIQTGMMIRSGQLHTIIGSGKIVQRTPYVLKQFFDTSSTRAYDAMRGSHWWPRWKNVHGSRVKRIAQKVLGAR